MKPYCFRPIPFTLAEVCDATMPVFVLQLVTQKYFLPQAFQAFHLAIFSPA